MRLAYSLGPEIGFTPNLRPAKAEVLHPQVQESQPPIRLRLGLNASQKMAKSPLTTQLALLPVGTCAMTSRTSGGASGDIPGMVASLHRSRGERRHHTSWQPDDAPTPGPLESASPNALSTSTPPILPTDQSGPIELNRRDAYRLFTQVPPSSSELDPSGQTVAVQVTLLRSAPVRLALVRSAPARSAF